jgi:6-pyruvoyl-tetrahydropterin synthase
MKDFKFLNDSEDEDEYEPIADNVASWMWGDETVLLTSEFNRYVTSHHWVIERTNAFGILEFLERFPDNSIVLIHSIEGNGIRHTSTESGRGWGFDIRGTEITIEYYKLTSNNQLISN